MHCPKCGTENPDNTPTCRSCGAGLPKAGVPSGDVVPRKSQLATAAFVLGILSLFTCGLTAIPAIFLGIVSFILIEKSGGRLSGRNFAVLGVVLPIILTSGIVLPAMLRVRQIAFRMACATNLAEIGMSMVTYVHDYDGKFPRSGGENGRWAMFIPNWRASNRFVAYGLAPDGSGGQGSITSCFYLLVKYSYPPRPGAFVCRGDAGTTPFNPADEAAGGQELIDFWDFGPEPRKHCSYSYHQPFGLYPLTTSSEPGMAVAADRNPWMQSPAHEAKTYPGLYNPNGDRKAIRAGNAIQHQEDGQMVLFVDSHVNFEKQPFCGVNDDNIYTYWDGGDIRRGGSPVAGYSSPMDKLDSFLVHDGQGVVPGVYRMPQRRR